MVEIYIQLGGYQQFSIPENNLRWGHGCFQSTSIAQENATEQPKHKTKYSFHSHNQV
jgi:hypothetical protein